MSAGKRRPGGLVVFSGALAPHPKPGRASPPGPPFGLGFAVAGLLGCAVAGGMCFACVGLGCAVAGLLGRWSGALTSGFGLGRDVWVRGEENLWWLG
jgi:hypothetical protein